MTIQLVPTLTDGSLSKKIEPSISSTRCFAMANPKPVPGSPPLWTKRWKSFFWSCFGMPGPVSSHSKRRVSLSIHPNFSVIEPVPVYLILFRERRCQHNASSVYRTVDNRNHSHSHFHLRIRHDVRQNLLHTIRVSQNPLWASCDGRVYECDPWADGWLQHLMDRLH